MLDEKTSKPSLYERLGGEAAVMAAVGIFYEKLLADPSVKHFFENLDMAALTRKQVAFMTRAFGGPAHYRGRDLRAAHADLVAHGLNDRHFDAVVRHLQATLKELGVAPDLIQEALGIVASTRNEVLNR